MKVAFSFARCTLVANASSTQSRSRSPSEPSSYAEPPWPISNAYWITLNLSTADGPPQRSCQSPPTAPGVGPNTVAMLFGFRSRFHLCIVSILFVSLKPVKFPFLRVVFLRTMPKERGCIRSSKPPPTEAEEPARELLNPGRESKGESEGMPFGTRGKRRGLWTGF